MFTQKDLIALALSAVGMIIGVGLMGFAIGRAMYLDKKKVM